MLRMSLLTVCLFGGAVLSEGQRVWAAESAAIPQLEAGAPQLANQRYLQGREDYRAGRISEAATAFQRALDVFPESPRLAFNLARSLERLGRLGEAAAAYRRYVELLPLAEDAPTVSRLAARSSRATRTTLGRSRVTMRRWSALTCPALHEP